MSRTQQDQFIDDDEEETCPLCVEEFDLSDKGFRPCPCGYQVCQFCYHNVRTNMNGLCPACRRPYDDSTIEFRKPSAEEEAAWKAKQSSRQKKTAVAQQKEVLKREADTLNRKHLAGLRVVQKNLVYVTGLSPSVQEDRLLETLRGQQYFGQYGKIVKIVVSKAKDNQSSVGVYVTYARKEDATQCITAVDGSPNGERTLRAQFGTTKYCSAYLRNEQCQNRNCMFLHEPGEEKDSFTRQDLSSMNVASSQHQQSAFMPQQAPPQSAQPVAAAARPDSTAPLQTPTEGPVPALPSSASWASKQYPPSRSVSRTAGTAASPALTNATTVSSSNPETITAQAPTPSASDDVHTDAQPPAPTALPPAITEKSAFVEYVERTLGAPFAPFIFDNSTFSEDEKRLMQTIPCLIDPLGGLKRRVFKDRLNEEHRRQLSLEASDDNDQSQTRGALQLGGEADSERHAANRSELDAAFALDTDLAQLSLINRGMTPTQQQLLQRFRSSPAPSAQSQQFGNVLDQKNPPGHARNTSRFSFANDTSSTTAVKPVANPRLMSQQSAMMPQQGANAQQSSSFYSSTMPGPPPGLKTTGTPPVSGGGMFAQGHGFATGGLGYGSNTTSRNTNDDMMRELYRRRELGTQDAAKQELQSTDPFIDATSQASSSFAPRLPAVEGRATPPRPPGLEGLGQIASSAAAGPEREGAHAGDLLSRHSSGVNADQAIKTPSKQHAQQSTGAVAQERSETLSPATSMQARVAPPPAREPILQNTTGGSQAPPAGAKPWANLSKDSVVPVTPSPPPKVESKLSAVGQSLRSYENTSPAPSKTPWQTISTERIASPSPLGGVASLDPTPGEAKAQQQSVRPDVSSLSSAVAKGSTTELPIRSQTPIATPPVSRPATPGSVADGSTKKRANVIRLVPTPKPETAPIITFPSAAPRILSRTASISSALPPGTPSNEHMSDTASVTSTNISRPTSPPVGGIIGSAAVRSQTKSQAKKARQERAKAMEEKGPAPAAAAVEEVQEAIVGRKKKAKKPAPAPKPKPIVETVAPSPSPAASKAELDGVVDTTVAPEETAVPAATREATPPPAPTEKSAASIIAELCAGSKIFASCVESMLRPIAQANSAFKPTRPASPKTAELPSVRFPHIKLGEEDLSQLLAGAPIRYGLEHESHWGHGVVTPGGAQLHHLEDMLEMDYIGMEITERKRPDHLRFHHRPMTEVHNEYPSLDFEMLRRMGKAARENNAMEKAVEEGSKKGSFLVGSAEGYIDEFVMPVAGGAKAVDGQAAAALADGEHEPAKKSIEELEQMLSAAKEVAEERENALRKVVKRNRKLAGLAD